jgi:hypothetical protein
MRYLFILFLLVKTIYIQAQAPSIEWQKCFGGTDNDGLFYGEWGFSHIQQTSDGGFILAATTASNDGDVSGNHGDHDIWILKFNNLGNIQWQKCLGGASGPSKSYCIKQVTDGGFIVVGTTKSNDGDASGNHGSYDIWVIKLDIFGNIEWQKCLGGTGYEIGTSIQQTTDGGYIVAGQTTSNDGDVLNGGYYSNGDIWILKLNNVGNIEWQKCYGGYGAETPGFSISVIQTIDGGFVFIGSTDSNNNGDVSGNHFVRDIWVVKINNTGSIQWQKCLGGMDNDEGYSIQQSNDGGYIVVGSVRSNDGDVSGNYGWADIWIVKLNNLGNIQWQKCYGGSSYENVKSIQKTNDGGYIVVGHTRSNDGDVSGHHGGYYDIWIFKINYIGNIEWQKCLGGSSDEIGVSILQTSDEGYILSGITYSNDGDVSGNHGSYDIWVVKLSSTTSIEEEEPSQLIIYPNPAKNYIEVSLDNNYRGEQFIIYNSLGQMVISGYIESEKNQIDISGLTMGLYTFYIDSQNGYSSKFIKE